MGLSSFPQSDLDIVAPDGTVRCSTRGIFARGTIAIEDVEPGDEIRRKLPNGREDVFRVDDPMFYEKTGGFAAHYQIKVSRKGNHPIRTGGHYFNLSGHNARVNIGSVDQSSNVAQGDDPFGGLRAAIGTIPVEADRAPLQDAVDRMEKSQGADSFKAAYKDFMSLAADHITILAPFIPAFTTML